jgi:hypothetical protein
VTCCRGGRTGIAEGLRRGLRVGRAVAAETGGAWQIGPVEEERKRESMQSKVGG